MADGEFSNEAASKAATRTWRIWRTAHEMCQDRGYEIADHEIAMSLDQFRARFCTADGVPDRSQLKFSARPSEEMIKRNTPPATKDNPNPTSDAGTVWVEFLNSDTFGTKEIRKFIEFCAGNNTRTGILITHLPLSAAARKVKDAAHQFTNVEVFLEDDLLINITHHTLVPKHIVLSREEKTALLKRYRLKETQLPRIMQKDPIAHYYGLKKGQVVKIIRNSETAGRYASYRVCV